MCRQLNILLAVKTTLLSDIKARQVSPNRITAKYKPIATGRQTLAETLCSRDTNRTHQW